MTFQEDSKRSRMRILDCLTLKLKSLRSSIPKPCINSNMEPQISRAFACCCPSPAHAVGVQWDQGHQSVCTMSSLACRLFCLHSNLQAKCALQNTPGARKAFHRQYVIQQFRVQFCLKYCDTLYARHQET